MNRALIIKELRESAALVALATLVGAWVLANLWGVALTPWDSRTAERWPFRQYLMETALPVLGGSFAVLLAMKQTAWEEMRGTFRYLLYRPIERRRVVMLKLAVGLALVMALTAAFILSHAAWAAAPGNHPSPFFWSMTEPAWRVWLVLPVIYLAAALSGMRPGRWWGSRLLPLAGGCTVAAILAAQPWWWVTLAGSAAVSCLLMACTVRVAQTREY
jgi:uncharacterized membrane protein YsdA (DUF1294 family)